MQQYQKIVKRVFFVTACTGVTWSTLTPVPDVWQLLSVASQLELVTHNCNQLGHACTATPTSTTWRNWLHSTVRWWGIVSKLAFICKYQANTWRQQAQINIVNTDFMGPTNNLQNDCFELVLTKLANIKWLYVVSKHCDLRKILPDIEKIGKIALKKGLTKLFYHV